MFSLTLLGLVCLKVVNAFICPTGFEQFPQEESCWNYNSQAESYHGAIRQCGFFKVQSQPAIQPSLVKIESLMENSLVYVTLAKLGAAQPPPYIGVEKTADGRWVYTDGSPLTYTNWSPGHPLNTTTAQCVVMDPPTGKWNSTDCSTLRSYFCSYKKECPEDWIYYPFTAACYYLKDFSFDTTGKWVTYTWNTAESLCVGMKGHLTSIHSVQENNFLLDWAISNVANLTGVFNGNPCSAAYVYMGFYGTGAIGVGNWKDGTPVDFTATTNQGTYYYWMMSNDPTCKLKGWTASSTSATAYNTARFFCKKASISQITLKTID